MYFVTFLSSLFRALWSIRTYSMATTTTQWWKTATSPTTSRWPTFSLLPSTLPFVSFVSQHGQCQNIQVQNEQSIPTLCVDFMYECMFSCLGKRSAQ